MQMSGSQSQLSALRPFILDHSDGLIRIDGRLANAPLLFSEKHPIVLANSHLSLLLIC